MPGVFISHATADDGFVAELRERLESFRIPVWVDSRSLRGGSVRRTPRPRKNQPSKQFLSDLVESVELTKYAEFPQILRNCGSARSHQA